MSNKAIKYIVIGYVLVMLAQSFEKVAVEFVKSAAEEPVPSMFMMPVPFGEGHLLLVQEVTVGIWRNYKS